MVISITRPRGLALDSSHSSIPHARLALCRANSKYNTGRRVWRSAAKFRQAQCGRSVSQGPGASLGSNSIKAACTSWQSIALFIIKPITHWLFGLGMLYRADGSPTYRSYSLMFRCLPLFTLGGCAILLAAYTTWMVRASPIGPQPAT